MDGNTTTKISNCILFFLKWLDVKVWIIIFCYKHIMFFEISMWDAGINGVDIGEKLKDGYIVIPTILLLDRSDEYIIHSCNELLI